MRAIEACVREDDWIDFRTRLRTPISRFGAVPADAAEADAFISDLYVHLVEEAAVVLNHRIRWVHKALL